MTRHTLLLHVRKNTLPPAVLEALLHEDLTVLTEPGHKQRYPDGVRVVEVSDVQDAGIVARAAAEAAARRPLDAVVSPFELGAPAAGHLRTALGLPGIGFETATLFCDKHRMRRRMLDAGLPAADNRPAWSVAQVRGAGAALGWPVVVKPLVGGGSIGVRVLRGPADCDRLDASGSGRPAAPLVVEQYVPLTAEYHCDGVVWDGQVVFVAVSRYLHPLLGCPPELNGSWVLADDDPVAVAAAQWHAATVTALGLTAGVTHMEFLQTGDTLLAGEIACRPSGGAVPAAVQRQFGVDLWAAFLDTAFQTAPRLAPRRRGGVVVNHHLPVEPGRVTELTAAARLAEVPGVVDVRMQLQVGDVVPDVYNSSFCSGTVLLQVPGPDDVDAAVARLNDVYRFRSEPVDEPRPESVLVGDPR